MARRPDSAPRELLPLPCPKLRWDLLCRFPRRGKRRLFAFLQNPPIHPEQQRKMQCLCFSKAGKVRKHLFGRLYFGFVLLRKFYLQKSKIIFGKFFHFLSFFGKKPK